MAESLRIGIACYPTLGGSGVVATELAVALAERGNDVQMFTYSTPHRSTRNVRLHLVDVVAYPLLRYPPYDLALASQVVDIVQRTGPLDILHVHYAIPHAISAYLAKEMLGDASFATITTLHGTDISIVGSDPAYATVTRFGIERSDGITAVSDSLRQDTFARLGVACEIEVIPNFVDGSVFKPRERTGGPFRVVHASNFREVKRPLDVIRVFSILLKHCNARLSLIGEGPELPAALKLASELGVCDFIDVLGTIAVPHDELSRADVFLLPSETESFGLSALESLASGVPVVASRVGGLPEVVTDGKSGFLHPVGDVEAMAASIFRIQQSPALRREMGSFASHDSLARFSKDKIVGDYVEYYKKVLSTRGTRKCRK